MSDRARDDSAFEVREEGGNSMVVGVKLDVLAELACPFCEGKVQVCIVRVSGCPATVHTQPTCSRFDDLDPAQFVSACRKKRVGEVGDA